MSAAPLGIIAGQGVLPLRIAQAQKQAGRSVFIVGVTGEADAGIEAFDHQWIAMGAFKQVADAFKQAGCQELIIIGAVQRPNIATMQTDEGGQWFLEKVTQGHQLGDDQLLKTLISYFQTQQLNVVSAETYCRDLLGPQGQQGKYAIGPHQPDIDLGQDVVKAIGALDIGQGVVVARRVVLAVEGPEGTDNMLRRIADLSPELRGTPEAPSGVLVKLPKPRQDRRVDMPTIGAQTIALAAEAHMAGIVYEAGGALIDDLAATIAAADAAGLFLYGLEASQDD